MQTINTKWLIWSIEHGAWWRAGERGYTLHREEAGEYSFEDAVRIVQGANIGERDVPNEAMILLQQSAHIVGQASEDIRERDFVSVEDETGEVRKSIESDEA